MSDITARQTITKQPVEKLWVKVDFSNRIPDGETLDGTPTVGIKIDGGETTTDLTVSDIAITGDNDEMVGFFVEDGNASTKYRLQVESDVSDGQHFALDVIVKVLDY
jgi:hypothetical protein